jgi:hypothetical protein
MPRCFHYLRRNRRASLFAGSFGSSAERCERSKPSRGKRYRDTADVRRRDTHIILNWENAMTAHLDLVDRYFAAWNETDAARRRALIQETWAEDASYVDPLLAGKGHEGIDAMIGAVHERFPKHTFRRSTDADGFGNYVRFSWDLIAPSGEAIVKGSDFGVVDAAGRFKSVTGFLDAAPGVA